jgi:hypothetical protein
MPFERPLRDHGHPRAAEIYRRYIALVGVALAMMAIVLAFYFNAQAASRAVEKAKSEACRSTRQVEKALLTILAPVDTKGVTDPAQLERLNTSNAARAEASKVLSKNLACDPTPDK